MVKRHATPVFLLPSFIGVYVICKLLTFTPTENTSTITSDSKSLKDLNPLVVSVVPIVNCNRTSFLAHPPLVKSKLEACTYCRHLTCENLLFNKTADVYDNGRKFMANHQPMVRTNEDFVQLTSNCEIFLKEYDFPLTPSSDVEANFPLAFNILMHRDVSQIVKLLRALYAPQNVYCIHVDARASSTLIDTIKSVANCFTNVHIASKLQKIIYAGMSRLEADVNCMKDHLRSSVKWKYLLNTAGQAFPIKSNREMVEILRLYNGSNDIEGLYARKYLDFRYVKIWREVGLDTNSPYLDETEEPYVKPPHNLDIVKGSAYGIFSHDFVQYLVDDPIAKDFFEWCRFTFSPDEIFWATLHHTYSNPHIKPPGGYSGFPDHKPFLGVYASWYDRDPCRGRWQRGSCVYGIEDLPFILSRDEFFINKLEESYEPLALECLQLWQRYKQSCTQQIDHAYYQSLSFIRKPLL